MAFYVTQKKTKKVLQLKRFPQVYMYYCIRTGKNCDRRVPPSRRLPATQNPQSRSRSCIVAVAAATLPVDRKGFVAQVWRPNRADKGGPGGEAMPYARVHSLCKMLHILG